MNEMTMNTVADNQKIAVDNLQKIATELLQNGVVKTIIGYTEGSKGKVRPLFVRQETEIGKLLFDKRCTFNLAVFLYKKEIVNYGKPAIIANINTLRSIMRLASEHQINNGGLIAITENSAGEIIVLNDFESIEKYLSEQDIQLNEKDRTMIDTLDAMTAEERWAFWQKEFSKCVKCFACRQACPLCYCTTCTVEKNQPQWVGVASNKLGNMEWHTMRTMHLAGRCTSCGQCAAVCPMDIPLHLLPIKLSEENRRLYGSVSGMTATENCALSTFKPDDKESFIG